MIQQMLVFWSLVPLPFLNPPWTSGSSWFTYCWNLAWRILSITLLAWEMCTIVRWFEHSLVLPFLGTGMNIDLFQLCGYCWVFQICYHWVQHLNSIIFRIWNGFAEIPSPPLALLAAVLPKAHLTSHSRMSGSGWVTTPSWLSSSLRIFVQFCVFLPSLLDLFCFY